MNTALDQARRALGMSDRLVDAIKPRLATDNGRPVDAETLMFNAVADALDVPATTHSHSITPKEPHTMSNPANIPTTSTPEQHRTAVADVLTALRETEQTLIDEIKERMSALANVQHSIRSYAALDINLAGKVGEAELQPVATGPAPVGVVPSAPAKPTPPAAS